MQKCVNFQKGVRKTKNICVLCAWLGEKLNSAVLEKPKSEQRAESSTHGACVGVCTMSTCPQQPPVG